MFSSKNCKVTKGLQKIRLLLNFYLDHKCKIEGCYFSEQELGENVLVRYSFDFTTKNSLILVLMVWKEIAYNAVHSVLKNI